MQAVWVPEKNHEWTRISTVLSPLIIRVSSCPFVVQKISGRIVHACDTWIRILHHVSSRPVLIEISRHEPIFYRRRQNANPFRGTGRAVAAFADVAF